MSSGEGIVLALRRYGEACQTTPGTKGVEVPSPSREDLVYIGLMPYVPYDPIMRGIEDIVHRYRDLDSTEVSTKVPRDTGECREHKVTDLSTESR